MKKKSLVFYGIGYLERNKKRFSYIHKIRGTLKVLIYIKTCVLIVD